MQLQLQLQSNQSPQRGRRQGQLPIPPPGQLNPGRVQHSASSSPHLVQPTSCNPALCPRVWGGRRCEEGVQGMVLHALPWRGTGGGGSVGTHLLLVSEKLNWALTVSLCRDGAPFFLLVRVVTANSWSTVSSPSSHRQHLRNKSIPSESGCSSAVSFVGYFQSIARVFAPHSSLLQLSTLIS